MATKVYVIDSTLANYTAEEISFFNTYGFNTGVLGDVGGLGLAVTAQGSPNMTVAVAIGSALISLTKNAVTWKVICVNSASLNLDIASNSSGVNRVDAIIVRIDKDAEPNALKNNIGTIEVVTGSGATALTDGAIATAISNDGFIRLANVTVANGASTITNANIADTRVRLRFNVYIKTGGKIVVTTTQSATPAINTNAGDIFNISGIAQAITSMTTNLTGNPNAGDMIEIIFTDNGTGRAITWGASFVSTVAVLPTTTVASAPLRVFLQRNTANNAWECVGSV